VRPVVLTLALAVAPALLVLVPASAGASAARTPVSLAATPARVTLEGTGRATVEVTNSGSRRVEIIVRRAGFALDLRGRPRIVRRARSERTASWLTVRPRRLVLRAGTKASLTISAKVPRRARPGDHNALVLLTTRPVRGVRVAVRMRLGVVVRVRAPGRISRGLELRRLRVRRTGKTRTLDLLVTNRGDVTEMLSPGHVSIVLHHAGRTIARLQPPPRELLPRTSGILQTRYSGRVRGRVTAVVEIADESKGGAIRRTFHLRL
jgi:hypothetical protein